MPDAALHDRERRIRRVLLLEGAANVVVLLAKAFVGIATGSMAVLADALHSLTDVANNIVAWFVVGMSQKPPDREHPYGHRKFETLAVFVLASMLTVLAIELALGALRHTREPLLDVPWGLPLMLAVLAVNIGIAVWESWQARRLRSDILRADARHTLSDVLTTVGVIIGWQLSMRGYWWLDTACAIAVAVLVFFLALGLFRRVVPVLVDRVAIEPEDLENAVRDVAGVHRVLQVRSRWDGFTRVVDMVITVDPHITTRAAHEIADRVEHLLEHEFDARDVTIHVEPEGEGGIDVEVEPER